MARRFRRRGQTDVPFHFIFALVGGVLFLAFFFILIRSVLTGSEDRDVRETSYAVETIITTSLTNPDAFTIAEVKNDEYRFGCEVLPNGKVSESYVQVGKGKDFDEKGLVYVPVFSPRVVKGDQLFTSTRTWEAPFPVANLAVLSNNRTRYVIVYSGNNQKAHDYVEKENLAGFGFDFVASGNLANYKDAGFDQYRFVYFNVKGADPSSIPSEFKKTGSSNSALVISFGEKGDASGTVTFYDDLAVLKPTSFSYYGTAMLDAALFSQDSAVFSCNMAKVFGRLQTASLILKGRLTSYPRPSQPPTQCDLIYQSASDYFDLYTVANFDFKKFAALTSSGGTIESLEESNRRLLSLQCPQLY